MSLYRLDYLNRRGSRIWVIPLAGTTITRDSALLPAVKRLGREPLMLEYGAAIALADRLNGHLAIMGMPGHIAPYQIG